ncbi:hypothetical protein ACEPT7_20570 [Burkholderia ubonensis]|uniref:hypothetical protein n=1 Tax=Burkholderia ubonensis TaxID=101571 RepID=UPI00358E7E55
MWRTLARSAFGHRVGDYFRPGFDGSMRVTPPTVGGSLAGNTLSSASSATHPTTAANGGSCRPPATRERHAPVESFAAVEVGISTAGGPKLKTRGSATRSAGGTPLAARRDTVAAGTSTSVAFPIGDHPGQAHGQLHFLEDSDETESDTRRRRMGDRRRVWCRGMLAYEPL